MHNNYRCETFNSYIQTQNIFGNKRAPSPSYIADIGSKFAVIKHLRYICDGGTQGT